MVGPGCGHELGEQERVLLAVGWEPLGTISLLSLIAYAALWMPLTVPRSAVMA